MLTPLARTAALLAAGLLVAAVARAQDPSPPVSRCPVPRGEARQETEVVLEVRVVTVPDQFFERIGVDFNVNTATDKAPQSNSTQFHPAGFVNDFTPDKFLSGLTPAGTFTPDLPTPACESKSGPVFLSDKQVYLFLEGVQGDPRSNVMQAPKITVLDGQTAHVDSTEKQNFVTGVEVVQRDGQPVVIPKSEEVVTGFRMSACPEVSADRRFVRLNLKLNQTDPASSDVPLCPVTVLLRDTQGRNPVPFTQFLQQPKMNTMHIEKEMTIPDGGTVLLGGVKKEVEVRSECGVPVLSKVPYVNRLFKNVGIGRETQTVYVLVTPRILVNEEEPRDHATPVGGPPAAHSPAASRELANQALPPYVIEPPDILLVEAVPHQPSLKNEQPICGQHLVRPDGTIGLGIYGSAFVGGMTIEHAREAVAEQIRKRVSKFDVRDLNVNVLAFNSKCYYVVTEVGGHGEQVYMFPYIGGETVLDALAHSEINGLPPVTDKTKVWVGRRGPDDAAQVMPVDWCGILRRGKTSTNYQLMPGDRVYVNKEEGPRVTLCKDAPCCSRTKAAGTEGSETVEAPTRGQAKVLAVLLQEYDAACAAGHTREAAKLAQAALVLDPMCFAKARGR